VRRGRWLRRALAAGGLAAALPAAPAGAQEPGETLPGPTLRYGVLYDVRILPSQRAAHVVLRLDNTESLLRWLRLRVDPDRHRNFEGNGTLTRGDGTVEWHPPAGAGRLEYDFRIDHLRDARSFDARCAEDWALFRGDDLVPPARVRSRVGAESAAHLRLRLPAGWSVAAPWEHEPDGLFRIDRPARRFDRPVGWLVAGRIGVLRERVAGTQLAVAGPLGHGLRRLDLLALLRWTVPSLRELLPEALPPRLLVVGAGDPMWRGGLSGPASLYVHADRPLISNDGTSPLLHELMHTVLRVRAGKGGDWLVEGLAEYYGLELLRRSRTLSRRRHEKILERLAVRGRGAPRLESGDVDGTVVARAVTVLRGLDRELREASDDRRSLDDVLRRVAGRDLLLTSDSFRAVAESVHGASLAGFFRRQLASG
jgi:hypothetical protein